MNESAKMTAKWIIKKWQGEKTGKPYEISEIDFNCLLNEGINLIWSLLCGGAGTPFNAANSYLGVGDSNTAADPSQTALLAATNKLYKGMDTGWPVFGTSQAAIWKATFLSAEANFAWNEFTVANGSSGAAVNLNRKVSTEGTKIAGQTWELTLVVDLA